MDKEKINLWVSKPYEVQISDLELLTKLIKKYPYFQALKAIQTKLLKETNSHLYPEKENQLALHTLDRTVLYQFLNNKFPSKKDATSKTEYLKENSITDLEKKTTRAKEDTDAISNKKDKKKQHKETSIAPKKVKEKIKKDPIEQAPKSDKKKKIKTPKEEHKKKIKDQTKNKFSYSEWLKRTKNSESTNPKDKKPSKIDLNIPNKKSISEKTTSKKETIPTKASIKRHLENPIIDAFIKENPKITPLKKETSFKKIPQEALKPIDSGDLMTETLAKIYLKQKNYTKAEQAYKILILKNPQKSGYFVDQIRLIKDLRENKDEL